MGSSTDIFGLYKPASGEGVGGSPDNNWSDEVNAAFDAIDSGLAWAPDVRFCRPLGNDGNTGRSWGDAMQSVLAAYDSLPFTGGTIYVSDADGDLYWDSAHTDRGLWLLGAEDPAYNGGSPAGGWRVRKTCRIVGVGGSQVVQNSHRAHQVLVQGGSQSDRSKPGLWLSGTGGSLEFINLATYYHAVSWRLGVTSDLAGTVDTSTITFDNCAGVVAGVAGCGPTVELGYAYWLFLKDVTLGATSDAYDLVSATRSGSIATFTTSIAHSMVAGDTVHVRSCTPSGYNSGSFASWRILTVPTSTSFTADLGADPGGSATTLGDVTPVLSYRRACIADRGDLWGGAALDSGLIRADGLMMNDGGFYYQPKGNNTVSSSIHLSQVTQEGTFDSKPSPPVFALRTKTYGDSAVGTAVNDILLENLNSADSGSNPMTVLVEGERTPYRIVTVINPGGPVSTQGNMTIIGDATNRTAIGIGGADGSIRGRIPGEARTFSPAVVRYPNLVSQTLTGGAWTTGRTAPDGTTNASSIAGATEQQVFFAGSQTLTAGDWIVAGVWRRFRTITTESDADQPLFQANAGAATTRFDGGPNNYFALNLYGPRWGDQAWEWLCEAHRVSTGDTGLDLFYKLRAGTGNTIDYFAPLLFKIPAADGLNAAEVTEFARHLRTYPTGTLAGDVSMLASERLVVPSGSLLVGGMKWLTGAGSPEGVVTANVGSLYTRSDGGAGTTLYVKESGTGNTGWNPAGSAASELIPVEFSSPSGEDLAVGGGTFRWYNDTGATLTFTEVRAAVGTAPTGSSILFDVNVDGTTIWSTQANRVSIAAAGHTGSQTTFNTTTIADGSYLTVDVDQVGSTIPGQNAVVTVWLTT